ncbi:Thiol-disulfide oxidoreductase ResA [Rosistilla carotiformis]|uniref:Thiol-disulfide oxidoreductase ResA n=1 Tax=Rosistilla carotiformis TaxID=2528017 RepID=A0A518JPH3_9BACT|nr:TlpA disulfide reductase family protein [Rosistilla carotiformis]QDV67433.1 Thiol-disulfide oxidoreductase ResA [Rosistilla carotiformis]
MYKSCFERTAVSLIGLGFFAGSLLAADPSAKDALSDAISPVQKNVEYARVKADEIPDCRVQSTKEPGWAGWYVLSPAGDKLRRFADTNNDKQIDLWCYYLGGVEVYRDIDSDFNGKADQYRWLGTAGSRWGIDKDEDGTVDTWKVISAEESTQELVHAIATKDSQRFARLLLSSAELGKLNLSDELSGRLGRKLNDAKSGFDAMVRKQTAIGAGAKWQHFIASQPGAVTQVVSNDSDQDLLVYENVVAMFEGDVPGKGGQLYVGTLVRVGNAWRVIDVPQLLDNSEGVAQTAGLFFSAPGAVPNLPAENAAGNESMQKLVAQMEAIEEKLRLAKSDADKASLHDDQAKVLEALISNARDANEASMWIRQMAETISAAIHGGEFEGGLARLDRLRRSIPGANKDLAAFVTFEYINADYGLKLQKPEADFAKIQEQKIKALTDFVAEYPTADESAKAMMDLALSKEFENEDKAAVAWYGKVIANFASSPEAQKAQGAIRRLDAIGNTLPLKGTTIDGRAFDLSRYRGRPVVIHYWATWCETCKQDMKLYRKLQAQYAGENVEFIGINVDTVKASAQDYLRENASVVNWPQLFDEGGLESSPLANILGVQTLPTTIVIDKQGKIAKTNVIATELEDEIKSIVR